MNNNSFGASRSSNPFEVESSDNYRFGNRNSSEELGHLQERIGRVENESLESTQRALRVLNETHEIGVKTAEELVRQGEKLQSVEEHLDDVNNKLTATQKNLNQIKSVFGGLKNKFFSSSSSSSSPKPKSNNEKSSSSMSNSKSMSSMRSSNESKQAECAVITNSDREKELNRNLEEMSVGLKRLANLGMDMQRELDRQDPMLDRLSTKVGATKGKIDNQNDQMRKIMKS